MGACSLNTGVGDFSVLPEPMLFALSGLPPSSLTSLNIFCLATFKSLAMFGRKFKLFDTSFRVFSPETFDSPPASAFFNTLEDITFFRLSGIFMLRCR